MSGLSEYLDTLKKAADNVAVSDQYSLRLDRDETITKVISDLCFKFIFLFSLIFRLVY